MKHLMTAVGIAIVSALLPAAAEPLPKDIAARIEAIPIQTLTISDEQFLKGDAYGKPTTIDDAEVSDRPIMMFHGISDDWVPIARCQAYLARLQQNSKKNVKLIAFPDTSHAYDYPNLPTSPTVAKNAQAILCVIVEEPLGTMTRACPQLGRSYPEQTESSRK
jgi:fermentation-respiration switch protein FrsA (DUF1100 family)